MCVFPRSADEAGWAGESADDAGAGEGAEAGDGFDAAGAFATPREAGEGEGESIAGTVSETFETDANDANVAKE